MSQIEIPDEHVFANDLQRGGYYVASGKIYQRFFDEHPDHPLRFKCLYEVGDNLFYEKKYAAARKTYQEFIAYCARQEHITEEEQSWVDAYVKMSESRIRSIDKMLKP